MKLARNTVITIILIACLLISDQLTKYLAVNYLKSGTSENFLFGLVQLVYAENSGAMLGLGDTLPAEVKFYLFTVAVTIVLILMLLYVIFKETPYSIRYLSMILIIGGGIGNLIDRLFNSGYVIDFIVLGTDSFHTGVFNFADFYVTIGVLAVFISSLLTKPQKKSPDDQVAR
ncbi:MAG: signal peptidase II [Melioribacteraceae bacterium]|nr:signal peptidase II [Melioribacteraceae bacterium]